MSSVSLEQARRRCESADYRPDLHLADAEHLPFPNNTFDIVYSYGVMHHGPDARQCLKEARLVLKPGGKARLLLYHHPTLIGLMLWFRYGAFRGKSLRQAVYEHLESPGTQSFTQDEVRSLMQSFDDVEMRLVFSPGDQLLNRPSVRFQSPVYRVIWGLFPRAVVRRLCGKLGLFLLTSAQKPIAWKRPIQSYANPQPDNFFRDGRAS